MKPALPERVAPDLADRLRARFESFPLVRDWGVEVLRVAPGKARLRLAANATTLNPGGDRVNGGVLASLADMACAVALCTAFDGAMPFYTADLHTRFLEPAAGEVEAEAVVLRLSPRSAVIDCRMSCGELVVAVSTSHFTIKAPR